MEPPTTIEFTGGDPTFTKEIWTANGSPSNLILGEGWTSIARMGLAYAPSLKRITIPSSLTSIGIGAFYTSSGLEEVTFAPGSGLTRIGSGAFSGATALQTIQIPASVVEIGTGAFGEAKGLTQVTFDPECRLDRIGDRIFSDAISLHTINLPPSVTIIGQGAFSGATALQKNYPSHMEYTRLMTISSQPFVKAQS